MGFRPEEHGRWGTLVRIGGGVAVLSMENVERAILQAGRRVEQEHLSSVMLDRAFGRVEAMAGAAVERSLVALGMPLGEFMSAERHRIYA
jgi:hypothetical protein